MPLRRDYSLLPPPISSRWSASTITTTSSSTSPSSSAISVTTTPTLTTTTDEDSDVSVLFTSEFQYYIPHLSTSDTAFYTASEEVFRPAIPTNSDAFHETYEAETDVDDQVPGHFDDIELPWIDEDGWTYYPRSMRREVAFYGFSDKKKMTRGRRIGHFMERVVRKCERFGWRKKHGSKGMWETGQKSAYGMFHDV